MAMGGLDYERVKDEFYPTPAWCTHGLMNGVKDYMTPHDHIWEPAAGEGDISKVLIGFNRAVVSTDLVCYGTKMTIYNPVDFLEVEQMPGRTTAIITNPPYGKVDKKTLSDAFVEHALELTKPVGGLVAMLLRNEFDSAKKRRKIFSNHRAYVAKLVLTARPRWFPDSTGSPRHNYAWFVWDWSKAHNNSEPVIRYIFK